MMNLDPAASGHPDAPPYAGFWIRIAANVLDVLMLAAVKEAVITGGLGLWVGRSVIDPARGTIVGSHDATALVLVLLPIVATIGFWFVAGATPGKMICGLRIIDAATGRRATAWQCIGRYFLGVLAVGIGVGYLWIVIDPRKQGWHDKVVRTVVLRTRSAPGATAPGSSADSWRAAPGRSPS